MEQLANHSHAPGRKLSCLLHVPIFNQLDDKTIDAVAGLVHPSHYKKGETVQQSGANHPRLLVLSRGRAKVARTSVDGKEQIVDWLRPGDFTDEVSVFTAEPSASEIIALEDSSFCTIDGAELKKVLAGSPELALAVIKELSQRLAGSQQQLESLGLMTAEQKVLNRLVELAAGRREFRLPMAKKDLAAELGMTPETLSRKLKDLASSDTILLSGQRTIKLL